MDTQPVRTERIYSMTSFVCFVIGILFAALVGMVTGGLAGSSAFALRALGWLLALFMMELGMILKLYAALARCHPPGADPTARAPRRESLFKLVAFGLTVVAVISLAYVLVSLPGNEQVQTVRAWDRQVAMELVEGSHRSIATGLLISDILLLLGAFGLLSALFDRFRRTPE